MCLHWLHFSVAMKEVGLRIRVERDLRDDFLEIRRARERPAAQLLRELVREYISRKGMPSPGTGASGRRRINCGEPAEALR